MLNGRRYGMGWIPDYPDFRDYTDKTEEVKTLLGVTQLRKKKTLPKSINLREWCSPVEDQGMLGSCTAHAVAVVGYDDRIKINNIYGQKETTGALLIRNSWGKGWGEEGYGWLPYDYILKGLAEDFWSVIKKEWVDAGEFNE